MRLIYVGLLVIPLFTFIACTSRVEEPVSIPVAEGVVSRGAELAQGLAACGFCHGEATDPRAPLRGGRSFSDIHGEVLAPNVTPSRSGVGEWTPRELAASLRGSLGKDAPLSTEVHAGYEWMSDADTLAIVSFLRTLPPIQNEVERRSISFLDRNTTGIFEVRRRLEGFVPEVDTRYPLQYGQYLVDHVARCTMCHNSPGGVVSADGYLTGGTITVEGVSKDAPDISGGDPNGTGSWSEKDMIHFLRTGERPDSTKVDPNFCPVEYYRNAADSDVVAIASYLNSLGSPAGS